VSDKSYLLEIVTPDRVIFSGAVTSLKAPGSEGYFGVLLNHQSMIASLRAGEVDIESPSDGARRMAISGGFFQIESHHAVILADTALWDSEIDVARAKQALERARDRSGHYDPDTDRKRAESSMARAEARLKVARADIRRSL